MSAYLLAFETPGASSGAAGELFTCKGLPKGYGVRVSGFVPFRGRLLFQRSMRESLRVSRETGTGASGWVGANARRRVVQLGVHGNGPMRDGGVSDCVGASALPAT
jgi:hypothetical protein